MSRPRLPRSTALACSASFKTSTSPARTTRLSCTHAWLLGDDLLQPYKAAIDRWLWPDVFKNQDTSVAKSKKAITDYIKASGTADGLAELMVFYCEQASGFSCDVGLDDEA